MEYFEHLWMQLPKHNSTAYSEILTILKANESSISSTTTTKQQLPSVKIIGIDNNVSGVSSDLSLLKAEQQQQQCPVERPLLTQNTCHYLEQQLFTRLYPTFEILQLLPNSFTIDVYYKTILHIINQLSHQDHQQNPTDNNSTGHNKIKNQQKYNLIFLLCNVDWPEWILNNLKRILFPLLKEQIIDVENINDQQKIIFWFYWLAKSVESSSSLSALSLPETVSDDDGEGDGGGDGGGGTDILKEFHKYVFQKVNLSRESIFSTATNWNQHFFYDLIYQKNIDDAEEENVDNDKDGGGDSNGISKNSNELHKYLSVAHMIDPLQYSWRQRQNPNQILQKIEQFGSVVQSETFFNDILNELKRLYRLKLHCPQLQIEDFSLATFSTTTKPPTQNLIELLAEKFNLLTRTVTPIDYSSLRLVLLDNQEVNMKILKINKEQLPVKFDEIEIYDQFVAIILIYDLIIVKQQTQQLTIDDIHKELKIVKHLLRSILYFPRYVQCVKIIFSLLFIRWNHLNHFNGNGGGGTTKINDNNHKQQQQQQHKLCVNSSKDSSDSVDNSENIKKNTTDKFGFICTSKLLVEKILELLKSSVTFKKHEIDQLNLDIDDKFDIKLAKDEFLNIFNDILDANWRLSILFKSKIGQTSQNGILPSDKVQTTVDLQTKPLPKLKFDMKKLLTAHNVRTIIKSSSDEDENEQNQHNQDITTNKQLKQQSKRKISTEKHNCSLTVSPALVQRRKLRKTPSTRRSTTDSDRSVYCSQSTESERRKSGGTGASGGGGGDFIDQMINIDYRRWSTIGVFDSLGVQRHGGGNIIYSMLGDITNLITICMNNSDLESTKAIIKKYSLNDASSSPSSSLISELKFTESYNQTKQKLAAIFTKYEQEQKLQQQSNQSDTHPIVVDSMIESKLTVERIKKVAAIGFEATKIINLIAKFAMENDLIIQFNQPTVITNAQQLPAPHVMSDSNFIDKYHTKYSYLKQYDTKTLQSTIAIDLVISLSNNYDICYNIWNMINKLWNKSGQMDRFFDNNNSNNQQIGYFPFFKQILECLQIENQSRRNDCGGGGLKRLIYDQFYPLKATEYGRCVERAKFYDSLRQTKPTEYDTFDKLKTFIKKFELISYATTNSTSISTITTHGNNYFFIRIIDFIKNTIRLLNLHHQQPATTSKIPIDISPTDLLAINLTKLIGEMIFKQNISPTDIESILCSLNINLINLICRLTSPRIESKTKLQSFNGYTDTSAKMIERFYEFITSDNNFHKDVQWTEIVGDVNDVLTAELEQNKTIFKINTAVLEYLEKHNSIVAFFIRKIQNIDAVTIAPSSSTMSVVGGGDKLTVDLNSSVILNNLLHLNEVEYLSVIFDDQNRWISALNLDTIKVLELMKFFTINRDYWKSFQCILSIKELNKTKKYFTTNQLNGLQDYFIKKIIYKSLKTISSNTNSSQQTMNYHLIERVTDINTKTKLLLKYIEQIESSKMVIRLINSILLDKKSKMVIPGNRKQLILWLDLLKIYDEIVKYFPDNTINWLHIKVTSLNSPEIILHKLLLANEYDLCLRWSKLHPFIDLTSNVGGGRISILPGRRPTNQTNKLTAIINIFTKTIINQREVNEKLYNLIETVVPTTQVVTLYASLLSRLKNIPILSYLIDFLLVNATGVDVIAIRKFQISLKILELTLSTVIAPSMELAATTIESSNLWNLMNMPLLMIEQILMNTHFETLGIVLEGIRPLIKDVQTCKYCVDHQDSIYDDSLFNTNSKVFTGVDGSGGVGGVGINSVKTADSSEFIIIHNEVAVHKDHCISENCIDSLLRIYASKAMDFRVIDSSSTITPDVLSSHVTDHQTIDSLDSLCGTFIMPRKIPTRENWTRDSEASHCMCCRRAVFTMLTRRHHCRRCGRVICHACSTKRQQIPSLYANILVRVCDDCFKQMEQTTKKLQQLGGGGGGGGVSSTSTSGSTTPRLQSAGAGRLSSSEEIPEWEFTGHPRHDELLRDEFCFEYAPSVSLCLSILAFHSARPECAHFLLHHCRKFQLFLKPTQPGHPNPEIDYALVTQMLHCLALAAKVRNDLSECDIILEDAEIIRSIVSNRCESLLPMEPISQNYFRKLRDSLVVAEKWQLSLEVSLKCGFPTASVMSSWGIACLRAGCMDTAREKFSHCLSKCANDDDLFKVFTLISYESNFDKQQIALLPNIRRPQRSPALLNEILQILDVTCHPTQEDVTTRASLIKSSNISLSTSKTIGKIKKEQIICNEPALNILHTLSNLNRISHGNYGVNNVRLFNSLTNTTTNTTATSNTTSSSATSVDGGSGGAGGGSILAQPLAVMNRLTATSLLLSATFRSSLSNANNNNNNAQSNNNRGCQNLKRLTPNSRFYDECLYYLNAYGNHQDLIQFLMKHDQYMIVLKYIQCQKVEVDCFIHCVFMVMVKKERTDQIISAMIELDETLLIWKSYIIPLCRYLERSSLFNCLYHLQILLKDPIRASMTCVKFYQMNCRNYLDLQTNTIHLTNALKHLQMELELCQWEEIKVGSSSSRVVGGNNRSNNNNTFESHHPHHSHQLNHRSENNLLMKMDSKTLNGHINTILRQIEVTKFLSNCEQAGRETIQLLPKISLESTRLPTLFGTIKDKIQLTVLTLICGTNIEEGFGLAFRIIQDFNLNISKIYGITAKYLAGNHRLHHVEQLINCIRSNNDGGEDFYVDNNGNDDGKNNINSIQSPVQQQHQQRQQQCDQTISIADEIISLAIYTTTDNQLSVPISTQNKQTIDILIKLISDVGTKINCHIASGQLKSAYLLAVQNNRLNDVRKLYRRAIQLKQTHIVRLCEKKLNIKNSPNSSNYASDS